jgi:hypothetical protein
LQKFELYFKNDFSRTFAQKAKQQIDKINLLFSGY